MSEVLQKVQAILDEELINHPDLRILEAGCGSASWLNFGGKARLVGIDISEKQLNRNTVVQEKIVGDIQRYEFPLNSFDCIVCYYVLEHVPQPELAIEKFSHALKPGGFIILGVPNVLSIKGLVTKLTPHVVHVLAYRYLWNDKNAGKDDTLPFRTHLRFSISLPAIRKQAKRLGLETGYCGTVDVGQLPWLQRKKLMLFPYLIVRMIVGALSFGRIGDSDMVILLKKASA